MENKIFPDWSGKKILLAEDEPVTVQYFKKIFLKNNVDISVVKDGDEAVNLIKNGADFDVILMDLKMPVKNGFEATREIKKIRPDITIIAQTAMAFPIDEENARKAGCDDYITKPIQYKSLIKKLIPYLGK